MKELLIMAGAALILFALFSGILILAIAWTHYPYGFTRRRRKWRGKR